MLFTRANVFISNETNALPAHREDLPWQAGPSLSCKMLDHRAGYVRTDTAEDLASTLEIAVEFLARSRADDRYWKWLVYAIHAAAQSTAALALEGGDGFLVQKPNVMKKMLAAHESDGAPVQPHMDNFLRLIEKSLVKGNLRPSAEPLFDELHIKSLRTLDDLRDEFIHFNVKSWSIEKLLIVECASKALEFVQHYTCITPAILWRDESHQRRINHATGALIQELQEVCGLAAF